jgi:hypothetical protein
MPVKKTLGKSKPKTKSKGKPNKTKSKVRIPVKKEDKLKKHGYDMHRSVIMRHRALHSAMNEYGAFSVFKMLNVLSIFFKNNHPALSEIAKKDREWVKGYMG